MTNDISRSEAAAKKLVTDILQPRVRRVKPLLNDPRLRGFLRVYCTAAGCLIRCAELFARDREFQLVEKKHKPLEIFTVVQQEPWVDDWPSTWQKAFYLNAAMLRIVSATERYLLYALRRLFSVDALSNEQAVYFWPVGMRLQLVYWSLKAQGTGDQPANSQSRRPPTVGLRRTASHRSPGELTPLLKIVSTDFLKIPDINGASSKVKRLKRFLQKEGAQDILSSYQLLESRRRLPCVPLVVTLVNAHKHLSGEASKMERRFPVEFCLALLAFCSLTDVFMEIHSRLPR